MWSLSKYAPRPRPQFSIFNDVKNERPWDREQQKLTDIELTDEYFQNSQGCIRWRFIREAYFYGYINVSKVVSLFQKWRDTKEYLWLEALDASDKHLCDVFVKAAKRGNDVYKKRLKEKFSFLDGLEPIYFFLDDYKIKTTPMLFITLTVDTKKYDLNTAWSKISHEYNTFITKLRQKYGHTVQFRVWESHESGYPHIHMVVYFNDKWFKVFEYKEKYRITKKHKDAIAKFWSMGNIDVQGVQDTHGAFSEVKKYITKNIWNEKGDLTNAMICLHNKQMYSISMCNPFLKNISACQKKGITDWKDKERHLIGHLKTWAKKDFIGAVWGSQIYFQFYIKERSGMAEPSATALVRESLHNYNICNVKLRFLGCVAYSDMQRFIPNLNEDWLICADPPPEMKFILELGRDELSLKKE